MPSFTRRITIDRTPDQVFDVLDDLPAAPQWMPAIKRITVLTPGMPMGVGFKWRETRRIFGILPMSFTLAVVQHHRPTTWGLGFNDGKIRMGATFELAAKGKGTAVVLTEEVDDLKGKPKRTERMFKMMEKQDDDLLERLKAHVEASTPAPAGSKPSRAPSSAKKAPAKKSTKKAGSKKR